MDSLEGAGGVEPEGSAMRYVAFVTHGSAGWVVLFPDFPDIEAQGLQLQDALRRARRELIDRAHILRMLGAPMPTPIPPAAVIRRPLYSGSMIAIISVAEGSGAGDSNVFQFGRS